MPLIRARWWHDRFINASFLFTNCRPSHTSSDVEDPPTGLLLPDSVSEA
jgi:hypothetical protein